MGFDFYDQFSAYSTADLLKIVRQGEHYQAEAIAAAERLLGEREISSVDEEQADHYLREKEAERLVAAARMDSYKTAVADWVEPVIRPTSEVQPLKWYRLFILMYGVYYAWSFYSFVRVEIRMFRHYRDFGDSGVMLLECGNIIYRSIAFYLLIRKRRWGWILLFAESAIWIISDLGQLYYQYKFRNIWRFNPAGAFFSLLIPIALVVFLWRGPIAEYFGVDEKVKKRTAWVAVTLGVLWVGYFLLA